MEGVAGSLLHWLTTFNVGSVNDSVQDYSDGVIISKVLHNIDSDFFNVTWLENIETDAGSNVNLKLTNLEIILKAILDYYEVLGQQITGFFMPDLNAVVQKNDVIELGQLLRLILGCAVKSHRKDEYIDTIMLMEENIQHDVMNAIDELMFKEIPPSFQSEAYTKLKNNLQGIIEDLNSVRASKEEVEEQCNELNLQVAVLSEEKNRLLSINEKLLERLNHIESFEDPSTLPGKQSEEMQQKIDLLQDELFKIETGRDELKVENQQKEIFDLQQKAKLLHQQLNNMIAELEKNKRKRFDYKMKLSSLNEINEDRRCERMKITNNLQNLISEINRNQDLHAAEVDLIKKQDNEGFQKLAEERKILIEKIHSTHKTWLEMDAKLKEEEENGEILEIELLNLKTKGMIISRNTEEK